MKFPLVLFAITTASLFHLSLSFIHNPKNYLICNKVNCPKPRGVCTRDNKCFCVDNYTTVANKEYGEYQCNYFQANHSLVFGLEFLIGFGIGHFYLGNIVLGSIKFSFVFITAVIVAIHPCFSENNKAARPLFFLKIVLGLIYVFWQIVDGILISTKFYTDSNGISMSSAWK